METAEYEYIGREYFVEKEKYVRIYDMVRSLGVGFENIFSVFYFIWKEM